MKVADERSITPASSIRALISGTAAALRQIHRDTHHLRTGLGELDALTRGRFRSAVSSWSSTDDDCAPPATWIRDANADRLVNLQECHLSVDFTSRPVPRGGRLNPSRIGLARRARLCPGDSQSVCAGWKEG